MVTTDRPDDELVQGLRSWARLMSDEDLRGERHDILWLLTADAAEVDDDIHRYSPESTCNSRVLRLSQLEAIERELTWRARKGLSNQPPRETGFPRATLDAIKARLPLEQLIGADIELRRRGRVLVGCCPFHDDRTPSLVVWPDNHFRCFGCGVHGDLFTWRQAYDRTDFRAAVATLAAMAGVAL